MTAVDARIAAEVGALVAELKGAPVQQTDWTRPFKALELDSLEVASLLLSVEEKYGFKISDQEAETLASIRDVAEHVARRARS